MLHALLMTTTTATTKRAEDLKFERKIARAAKALAKMETELFQMVAEGRELGLCDEQVGDLLSARTALGIAAYRFRAAARHVTENK